DHVRAAQGREERLSHLSDPLGARHRDLEHAAADLTACTSEHLLDLLAWERRGSSWRGRRRRPKRRPARGQCLAKSLGELNRITVTREVHIHDMRGRLVEMVV